MEAVPTHEKLTGVQAYEAALDRLLARPQRLLRVFDRQFGRNWNTVVRHDLLRCFLLGGRANRIQIVLHDASNLVRDCPRLMLLLRQFSHAVTIHETEPHARHVHDPFALADDRDHLHRFHYDDARSLLALDDPNGTRVLADRFVELWEASGPTAAATTLGL